MIELTPARCEDGVRFDVAVVLFIAAEPIVAPTYDVGDDDGGTPAAVAAHIVASVIFASSVMVMVMMTVWK